jgi:glutamate/tyrosine decarboxylase-like PLP-dependent enzyme
MKWLSVLNANPHLSDRYRQRYAILLNQLDANATEAQRNEAQRLATTHAPRAVATLLGVTPPRDADGATWHVVAQGSTQPPGLVGLGQVIAESPALEQTRVPLHPSRHAHVLADGSIALQWSAESVQPRADNTRRFTEIAGLASDSAPLPIRVFDEYTICAAGREHVWVLSPHLGITLEDCLRDHEIDRQPVIETLRALRAAMIERGQIWQGFAPRNMFLVDDTLVLIDFEEMVEVATDPVRAAECQLWHQVFFADCLEEAEFASLFGDEGNDVPSQTIVPADSFERALLNVEVVTFGQRRDLLLASVGLEGRHRRPDGGLLFGHELGHFWGDFVPVEIETRIFSSLAGVADRSERTACLEVFEAAMEADIIRSLRQHALGDTNVLAPHTAALTEALVSAGTARLASARRGVIDWYGRLAIDPGLLVESVTFDLAGSASASDVLIGAAGTREATEIALREAVGIGVAFLHRAERGEPALRHADPDELRGLAAGSLPDAGADFADVLVETSRLVEAHSISQSHPGYLAFPDSANSLAAVAGSMLTRLLNQNLIAVDRSAPVATFIEIQVIEWLRELAGYDTVPIDQLRGVKDVGGLWTTGGHLSNHIAMLAALGQAFPQARRDGLRSLDTQPAVIMSGPIAHYSHSDAAFHLGLGWDNVLPVAATAGHTTDVDAVEKILVDPPDGRTPFMVVGVAGNCRTTGLDDLAALGEVCRRHAVWFHVDACHGGSLLFSPSLRVRHLSGIELADSISLDPHKGLFTPYPSSYVLFKDRSMLTQFSRHEAMVQHDDCWDLGLITPFLGSRGFESLATWMMLRHIGVRRLGQLVEQRQALVRHLERRLDAAGLFVRLNDVDFYRLAFVFCPPAVRAAIQRLHPSERPRAAKIVSEYTSSLNTTLYQAGRVCFDEHTLTDLANRVGVGPVSLTVMGACPGNALLSQADLDQAVARLTEAARPLIAPMVAAIHDAADVGGTTRLGGPAGWSEV